MPLVFTERHEFPSLTFVIEMPKYVTHAEATTYCRKATTVHNNRSILITIYSTSC